MADRIVVMKDGHIQQVGTPAELYQNPPTPSSPRFIGAPSMNLLPGRAEGGKLTLDGGATVPGTTSANGAVTVGIRPEDLTLASDGGLLRGTVTVAEPLGADTLLYVDVDGTEVVASGPGRNAPGPGEVVALSPDPQAIHVFDATSGAAIR